MTGTGISTDPYIVDNWNDLVSKMQEYNAYIELDPNSENKVIDMNGVAPNGVGNISIKFKNLKGNNWTIKNIYCPYSCFLDYRSVSTSSGESSHSIVFENLNIINIYKNDSGGTSNCCVFASNVNGYPLAFKNCKISCVIASGSTSSYPTCFADYVNFFNCSINIKSVSQYFKLFTGWNQYGMCSMQNCNVKINAQNVKGFLSYFNISDTKISGSVKALSSFIDSYTKFSTVVIDLSTDYTGTISDKACGLINSDKAPNITAGTGMNLVTTEQMTNAEYLASIGFPIFTEG